MENKIFIIISFVSNTENLTLKAGFTNFRDFTYQRNLRENLLGWVVL